MKIHEKFRRKILKKRLVYFPESGYNFCEVTSMSKGKSIAGFVLGIIVALCGVSVIVLNAVGMKNDY